MPFESGALISRSLWVIFIGEWGVWTRAVLPVDDRLDMPDGKSITGLCASRRRGLIRLRMRRAWPSRTRAQKHWA
jgi:hypothetical protein